MSVRGVTSVSKQPGPHACVFDLASAKLTGALIHGRVAHGINMRKGCFYTAALHPKMSSIIPPHHTCVHSHQQFTSLFVLDAKNSITDTQAAVVPSSIFSCLGRQEKAQQHSRLASMIATWAQPSYTQLLPFTHPTHPWLYAYDKCIYSRLAHTHAKQKHVQPTSANNCRRVDAPKHT